MKKHASEKNDSLAPLIAYPSYKSFDEFIDIERLRALDGYVSRRIKRRLDAHQDYEFNTGPYRFSKKSSARPGSKIIYLSQSVLPENYFDLDRPELWHPTEAAIEFTLLTEFIKTLPFQATGRTMIIYDEESRPVTAHRDHVRPRVCHEFVWFRTNRNKRFYVLNGQTGKKKYVESYSAWFDTVNQFHGADAGSGLSFSIRVDGVYTDKFRERIPTPPFNAASTPAFWASFDE